MHFRLQSLLKVLVLGVVCMLGTGCVTIHCFLLHPGDNSRNVVIRTKPEGADIYYNGSYLGKSPCSVFLDLKKIDPVALVRIEKDGEYVGHLQMTENIYKDKYNDALFLMCFDIITIVPFFVDLICVPSIMKIRSFIYDNPRQRIVYDGRKINLDKITHGTPPSGYWRCISPFSDLYCEVPLGDCEVSLGAIFKGWDSNGSYYYRTPDGSYYYGSYYYRTPEQVIAQKQAQLAMINATINGVNQFSQQMQQLSQQQYQPPPSPAPRPTPAAPAPTNTQRTVTPTTPNFKRFCPRTYKSGVVHGEWDGRFSVGCPACRGTINW